MNLVAIAAGGALGALFRYGLSGLVSGPQTTGLPWGTILVNLLGSFVIGVMSGVFDQLVVNGHFKTFLLIGLIGAFTTFSTLMIESVRLFQAGRISLALANLLVSNLLGLTCVLAGFAGVRLLAHVLR